MATITFDRMAAGGMHDHVGGGFHRYSTDPQWLVPHFEKMLYDNARSFKDGRAQHTAYLDDYAFLTAALLDLFEATGNLRWCVRPSRSIGSSRPTTRTGPMAASF